MDINRGTIWTFSYNEDTRLGLRLKNVFVHLNQRVHKLRFHYVREDYLFSFTVVKSLFSLLILTFIETRSWIVFHRILETTKISHFYFSCIVLGKETQETRGLDLTYFITFCLFVCFLTGTLYGNSFFDSTLTWILSVSFIRKLPKKTKKRFVII